MLYNFVNAVNFSLRSLFRALLRRYTCTDGRTETITKYNDSRLKQVLDVDQLG